MIREAATVKLEAGLCLFQLCVCLRFRRRCTACHFRDGVFRTPEELISAHSLLCLRPEMRRLAAARGQILRSTGLRFLWPYQPPDPGHNGEYDNDQEGLPTIGVGLYPKQRQQACNEADASKKSDLHEHGRALT